MDTSTFQKISRDLCKYFHYHRVGGYDPKTGLAWACRKKSGFMFHIVVKTGWPTYEHAYTQVTRFQEGYAGARGNSGLWCCHIRPDGFPAYANRFLNVGLFFEGLADASDDRGYFHIKTDGTPAYGSRFNRVGHFCYGLAQAEDKTGCFHIKTDGTPAYTLRGLGNGPFNKQGVAWTKVIKIVKAKQMIVRVWINTLGEIVTE